ncbi:nitrate reductase molybdenum cofactor assembly chaperone [Corynebacterium sp.]|uniref:nitrate reductase molybdenum cofactor assembly chaperone n=1 Tax=Corynebacterium sp. TaxID=1720 RepID=UPI0026DB788A|nr:nitrate reductase molybdenum cofactor assembly chaperone [Corynebacterium sp.]MDO5031954.1 nitrate reductase molybdenum cofactor assembly chaperone [Corynebacterium sp.]
MGSAGGAKDLKRTARTHTGPVPTDFVEPVSLSEEQRRTVAMAAAVLLHYPGADYLERLRVVEDSVRELPREVTERCAEFAAWAREAGLRGVEEHYVDTFDQRRRCSLYLSYYAVGDTRQRGMAILAFRQQLESMGLIPSEDELADHLCVVLEAVAMTEGAQHAHAVEMLASHRQGLEVLRAALLGLGSPFAALITAVCASLPAVDPATAQKYVDLIRTGPPAEMVGIADLPFPTSQPDYV